MLTGKQVVNINVNQIIQNRYQPRDNVDSTKLQALAESIKKFGMIQPIILRKVNEMYEIVVGGRRYEASKIVGFNEVPAIVVDISDNDMAALTLTENMQKEELSPIEEAKSYKKLQEENNLTITDISLQTGKTESYINNKLKLLTLAPEVQTALLNNSISEGHARILLKIPDNKKQVEVLNKIILERLPVKETSTYIESLNLIPNNDYSINANTDRVSLNDLTKENLNIKSALDDMEPTNKNSPLFNQKEWINKEKKEEKNMNMNSLNQVAQNNNEQTEGTGNTGFFPSFDNEPANMNMGQTLNNPDINMVNNVNPTNYGQTQEPVMNAFEQPQMQDINVQSFMSNPQMVNPNMEQGTFNQMPSFNNFEQPQPQAFEQNQQAPVYTQNQDYNVNLVNPSMPSMMQQPQIQTQNTIDVIPAVNAIRNFASTLEQMGYKIVKEEQDGTNEYSISLKVQKIA